MSGTESNYMQDVWENKALRQQPGELEYDFQARKKLKRQERKLQFRFRTIWLPQFFGPAQKKLMKEMSEKMKEFANGS